MEHFLPLRLASSLRLRRLLTGSLAIAALWGGSARATNYYWDDNGPTAGTSATPTGTLGTDAFLNTISTGGSGGTFATTPTSADAIKFVASATTTDTTSGSTAYTVNVNGNQSVSGLVFSSPGALTLGDAVGSGTITLGTGGIIQNRYIGGAIGALSGSGTTAGRATVNANLVLAGNQTWNTTNVTVGAGSAALFIAGDTTGTGDLSLSAGTNRGILVSGGLNMAGALNVITGNGQSPNVSVSGAIGANVTGLNVAFTNSSAPLNNFFNLVNPAGNTYTGTTTVSNGVLRIGATSAGASATGDGPVNLTAATALITGNGRSAGMLTVTNGGILAPANVTFTASTGAAGSSGVATFSLGTTGGIALTSATLNMDLSTSAASGNDLIVTSTLTLGGLLTVNINSLGAALDAGPYTLIDANGTGPLDLSGTAITTNFTGTAGTYTPTYSSNATGDLLVSFAPVPEPSACAALAVGAGVLGWVALRRQGGAGRA